MNIRHLHEAGQTHTMCGMGRTQCLSVHVTKARKSDCGKCREMYRAEIRRRRVRSMQTVKNQTARPPRDQCPKCFEPMTVGHVCDPRPIKPEVAAHMNEQCGNPECGVCHICQWNHKTSAHPKQKVYLLVEEIQSGSYDGQGTYVVLSAHTTEEGRERAREAWMESHEGNSAEAHAFEPIDGDSPDWCEVCDCAVVGDDVELED